MPEPSPRPIALARTAAAGGGREAVQPDRAPARPSRRRGSLALLDLDQVAHGVQHAARLLCVLDLDGVADAAQAQRAQGVQLFAVGAVLGAALGDGRASPSGRGVSSADHGGSLGSRAALRRPRAAARPGHCGCSPPRPSTWSIDRPRSFATSSGVRRPRRPAIVALTRLIGFCVPRLLERMSWMPASSSTARTPPPAITPVPGDGRLQQHAPGAEDAGRLVGDRAAVLGHAEEVLLGPLDALLDRQRNLVGLAVADADDFAFVADHDQRGEGEAPAALDDLGDAVDLDDALLEVQAGRVD